MTPTAPTGVVAALDSRNPTAVLQPRAEAARQRADVDFGSGAGALAASTVGTMLVSRRLRRQTHGLGPTEMTRMYEHHDAVLHAVRAGVLIIGADGRLLLVNDDARRLFDLPTDAERRYVDDIGLDSKTVRLPASADPVTDGKIGTTLDVVRTAQELTEVAVPRFADVVAVDLLDAVVQGEEPAREPWGQMRHTAISGHRDGLPLYPEGELITFRPGTPQARALETGRALVDADLLGTGEWREQDPDRARRMLVVGHGLHAAATMGRLRTAIHNSSALDLSADELLGYLDELVTHMDADESEEEAEHEVTGATCLYAIYDAVSGTCTIARAGHLGPALVHPNGAVSFPDTPVSPPLGLGGGLPVETATLHLPEGSRLALFTDGLIEDRHRDLDTGLELLRDVLAQTHRTPEQTCQAAFELGFTSEPITSELITTELITSELVANAIRYGTQPARLRLLHDRTLICEVADGSSTSPHLRRAATTDEGGRALFLVAQFAQRWGTRYTARGKIIWTEQSLHDDGAAPTTALTGALLDQWEE